MSSYYNRHNHVPTSQTIPQGGYRPARLGQEATGSWSNGAWEEVGSPPKFRGNLLAAATEFAQRYPALAHMVLPILAGAIALAPVANALVQEHAQHDREHDNPITSNLGGFIPIRKPTLSTATNPPCVGEKEPGPNIIQLSVPVCGNVSAEDPSDEHVLQLFKRQEVSISLDTGNQPNLCMGLEQTMQPDAARQSLPLALGGTEIITTLPPGEWKFSVQECHQGDAASGVSYTFMVDSLASTISSTAAVDPATIPMERPFGITATVTFENTGGQRVITTTLTTDHEITTADEEIIVSVPYGTSKIDIPFTAEQGWPLGEVKAITLTFTPDGVYSWQKVLHVGQRGPYNVFMPLATRNVFPPSDKVAIMAAGNAQGLNLADEITGNICEMNAALEHLGLEDRDIFILSGDNVVCDPAVGNISDSVTLEEMTGHQVINSLASQLKSLPQNSSAFIYLTGHGVELSQLNPNAGMVINSLGEILSSAEMIEMLNEVHNERTDIQILLPVEICFAGQFLPAGEIPGIGVIASAIDRSFVIVPWGTDFTRYYSDAVLAGADFASAFKYAAGKVLEIFGDQIAIAASDSDPTNNATANSPLDHPDLAWILEFWKAFTSP